MQDTEILRVVVKENLTESLIDGFVSDLVSQHDTFTCFLPGFFMVACSLKLPRISPSKIVRMTSIRSQPSVHTVVSRVNRVFRWSLKLDSHIPAHTPSLVNLKNDDPWVVNINTYTYFMRCCTELRVCERWPSDSSMNLRSMMSTLLLFELYHSGVWCSGTRSVARPSILAAN